MALYAPAHPARAKSAQVAFEAVQELHTIQHLRSLDRMAEQPLERLGIRGRAHHADAE